MSNKKSDRQIALDEFEKYLISGFSKDMTPNSYSIILAMNALQTLLDQREREEEE